MTIYSGLLGTGGYLPETVLTNEEISRTVETTHEWIVERTGIRERRIAARHETASSMAEAAARQAIEAAGIEPDQIDLIIVGTGTPDRVFPSTACLLQHRLGLRRGAAFDVQAACSGFIYALSVADQFIRAGNARHVLVVGSELNSRLVDWTDRTTCVLFGDGAGAVVLQAGEQPGILATDIHSDGRHVDILCVPGHIHGGAVTGDPFLRMDGQAVFKFAVRVLDEVARETLALCGMQPGNVDWLIPHQANVRILEATAKKLGLDSSHVVVTVDRHANTSAASVPLALDVAIRDGRIKAGQKVLLEGVGGGFTWGAALVEM